MGAHPRSLSRAFVILATTVTVLATMAVAPADATDGGAEDIESLRADVIGTFDYKIGLLTDRKSETDNPDRVAVYDGGIEELASVRDAQVPAATTVDELWALDDLAHSIYHETVAAAEAVPPTPEEELATAKELASSTIATKITKLRQWAEGCDDPNVQAIVASGLAELEALYPLVDAAQTADDAYAIKRRAKDIYHQTIDAAENAKADPEEQEPVEEEPKPAEKTPEQKAAEALARARASTLGLIDDKIAVLRAAAEAELVPAIVKVYENAADDIDGYRDDVEAAQSKNELADIEAQVLGIYDAAKEAAMSIRNSEGGDPTETLNDYLERVASYVTTTTQIAERTQDESPDTFADLVAARDEVLRRVDRVADVIDSGDALGDRWEQLNEALRDFRLALIRHYIALGEPITINGIQIPG